MNGMGKILGGVGHVEKESFNSFPALNGEVWKNRYSITSIRDLCKKTDTAPSIMNCAQKRGCKQIKTKSQVSPLDKK